MLIWDAHAGFETRSADDLATLEIWKAAGVDFLSVNVGYDVNTWQDTITALALARGWLRRTDGYRLVAGVEDIDLAIAAGEMAVAFDIEGMNALNGSVEMVRFYYDLGVRQMLFAYNLNNAAGGGCHDEDIGLSAFGREVVAEMNAVGMVIDCSHCGYRTTMEAMEISRDPVVFSHSNARALRDHERNIRDDQARRCAATGGVVGVNGIGPFVGTDDISTTSITDHIEYYLDLIGAKHVGIGLDYFHATGNGDSFSDTLSQNDHFWPKSQYPDSEIRCAAPMQFGEIAEELARRNHRDETVRAVLGGNYRRVARQVWK
ncbi:MAG: membrane dipeptidase [Alphaproteobacteria bacterium]|nr:membrane dipeptidase [Alphaproteobacteria bacterium]